MTVRAARRRTITLLAVGITVALLGVRPVSAQHVRGVVRDSLGRQPIGGAVVWLTDSAGHFLARSIADDAGHYAVMRLSGSAQLHVVRIGFHPVIVAVGRAPDDTLLDVALGPIAQSLGPLTLAQRRVCPGDKGTNAALDLWEQARAALLASVVARELGAPTLRMKSYSRTINPTTHEESDQTTDDRSLVGDHSYVAARAPGLFVSDGYMRESHGNRTFYAPDDEVLLDTTFAGTHCLRVVEGKDERAGQVGIAFEPIPSRLRDTVVDVQGVLWLAPARHELRSLEFHYTALEHEAAVSGGEITFHVMPTGAPMITEWVIRSAQLSVLDPIEPSGIHHRVFDRRDRQNVRLMSIRETGGIVVSASWPNGKVWHASLRTISGQLIPESSTSIAGMNVWLENSPDTVPAKANGEFTFTDVVPGVYMVMVADSSLAKVGVVRGRRIIDVRADDHLQAHILVPPIHHVIAAQCDPQPSPPGSGVLLGRVVDDVGAPMADVTIDATWRPRAAGDATDPHPDRETRSDDTGRFAICGAPLGKQVRLRATRAGASAEVEWTQRPLLTMTFVLRPAAQ